jgi:hypothetical protein
MATPLLPPLDKNGLLCFAQADGCGKREQTLMPTRFAASCATDCVALVVKPETCATDQLH